MNVNRRGSGINVVRVRVLVAGLVLLAVGCIALGRSFRHLQPGQNTLAQLSPVQKAASAAVPLPKSSPKLGAAALAAFNHLPMMFEPNVGQTATRKSDPAVKFVARGSGYGLFLTPEGAVMSLRSHSSKNKTDAASLEALSMKFVGANPNPVIAGADLLPGKTNYYIGGDSSQWHSGVSQFARVRYENVYPGVNLVFYGNQGQLEYDFQIAPGANATQPELQFDGAKHLQLSQGNLIVRGKNGSMQFEAPHVYQQIDGRKQLVEGRFELRAENRVGFAIGAYDHSRELTIDPKLNYSTYFGGTGDETCPSFTGNIASSTPGCPAIAVDNGGNIYLTGTTTSSIASFPQPLGGTPTLLGTPNVYVAEINTTGGQQGLTYLTFLGGGGTDVPAGIAVDGGGAAYIAGTTSSGIGGATDFPVTVSTAYQKTPQTGSAGTAHVFVTVLQAGTGLLGNYSSYLSGSGTDIASGVAIDSNQDVFITGTTTSTNPSDAGTSQNQFPVSNLPQALPYQQLPRANIQFFVTKVNTAAPGSASIAYSTYFGGNTFNTTDPIVIGGGIAADSTGNVFFTGTTNFTFTGLSPNTDFPILNAYQPCLDQTPPVTIVNPVVCTNTTETASDAFVAKLNPNAAQGAQLIWSTYFGGSATDSGVGVAVDPGAASVYITGSTNSTDVTTSSNTTTFQSFQFCLDVYPNPATLPCPAPANPAPTDAYVAKLSNPSTGIMSLNYFSYIGGSDDDAGQAITVDTAGGALVTGWTQSSNFPVLPANNTIQSVLKGSQDAFLTRINTVATTGQTTTGSYSSYFGGSGVDQGTGVALDTNLNTYFAGTTTSPDLQTTGSLALQPALQGPSDAFAVQVGTAADLAITGILSLGTGQSFISAGNKATFIYTVTNNGPDLATNVTVTDDLTGTGVPLTFSSASATSGTCNSATTGTNPNVVCNITSLQAGSTATVTISLVPTAAGSFNGGDVKVNSASNNDPIANNNDSKVTGHASDFNIIVNPSNQSIPAAGDTASYTVLLGPLPIYGSAISFSCAKLPSAAACNFTPTSVTLNSSSPGSTALNINTTARPTSAASLTHHSRGFYAAWFALPGMALFGFGVGGRRRKKIFGALLLCMLFAVLILQPACKSSTQTTPAAGTPPGTYTITVTATSGSLSHSSSITLTVP